MKICEELHAMTRIVGTVRVYGVWGTLGSVTICLQTSFLLT